MDMRKAIEATGSSGSMLERAQQAQHATQQGQFLHCQTQQPGGAPTEGAAFRQPDFGAPTSVPAQASSPLAQPARPSLSCQQLVRSSLKGGQQLPADDAARHRFELFRQLPFHLALALELLQLPVDGISLDFLLGLSRPSTEPIQQALLAGASRAAAGGTGGGVESAERKVQELFGEMRHAGMVAKDAAGNLCYQPSAPQLPPYRTIRAKARLLHSSPGASSGVRHGPSAVRIEQFSLEVEKDGSYLTRHPLLAGHDRLLRLEVEASLAAPPTTGGQRDAVWGALAPLLVEGLVFAGRKYMFLMSKESTVWLLAVRSVRLADTWLHMSHPIKEAWELLGAAVELPTVQGMAARAELWASTAVGLALDGWRVRYEPDRTATDPATGETIKLTDGAGRASVDLWDLVPAAWEAHWDAARAASGERNFWELSGGRGRPPPAAAAGQPSYKARTAAVHGQRECMPVQMRLHHALLANKPRVLAKGMLSPDARLPCRTIVLPYSCVKTPARKDLEIWVEIEGAVGDGRDREDNGADEQGGRRQQRQQGGAAAVSGGVEAGVSRRGYTACVQLELLNCGGPVRASHLNQNLLPLLVHHGLPREFLFGLLEDALREVRGATQTPATAIAALCSLNGRFSPLWQRLAAKWGYTDLGAWERPDAHLQRELRDLRRDLLSRVRRMKIPLPESFMALGVPDHTASLPPRHVVLLDDNGRSVVTARTRCLLYRDPELSPAGLLAAWVVPPPLEVMAGFARELRSALVMPVTGGESLAALMAGGDYDGDTFHVIIQPDAVAACWPGLAARQRVADTGEGPAGGRDVKQELKPEQHGSLQERQQQQWPPSSHYQQQQQQQQQQQKWPQQQQGQLQQQSQLHRSAEPQQHYPPTQHLSQQQQQHRQHEYQLQGQQQPQVQQQQYQHGQQHQWQQPQPQQQLHSQHQQQLQQQPQQQRAHNQHQHQQQPHSQHGPLQQYPQQHQQCQQHPQPSQKQPQPQGPAAAGMPYTPPRSAAPGSAHTPGASRTSGSSNIRPPAPAPAAPAAVPRTPESPHPPATARAGALSTQQAAGLPGGGGGGAGPRQGGQRARLAAAAMAAVAAAAAKVPQDRRLGHVAALQEWRLWKLPPQMEDEDPSDIITQLVHFYLHAQACGSAIGKFHSHWLRFMELPEAEGGGVGGPLCLAMAEGYAKALDAKKNSAPTMPPAIESLARELPDPEWHREAGKKRADADSSSLQPWRPRQQQQGGDGATNPSVMTELYRRMGEDSLDAPDGAPGSAAPWQGREGWGPGLEVHAGLLRLAREVVASQPAWEALMALCSQVVRAEWGRPWVLHIADQERTRVASTRDAARRDEAAATGLRQRLVRGVQRALVREARHLLPGRLQLGDMVADDTSGAAAASVDGAEAAAASMLDLRPRVALAVALYAAEYSRRAHEEQPQLGVVWLVAGAELNMAHNMLCNDGRLPTIEMPRER